MQIANIHFAELKTERAKSGARVTSEARLGARGGSAPTATDLG